MIKETYSLEEIQESVSSYFDNDPLPTSVWINKYALKNKEGYIETSPSDTLKRLAKEIYRIESKYSAPRSYEEILSHIDNFQEFIFGGSILFGLGNKNQLSSLGNCFFVDNGADSYGSIFNMDETAAQLMKRRGGVGLTLENLRPIGATVYNSAQTSTGAISFMDRYSATTREVAQDGRRGALMLSFDVRHNDIEAFIVKKDDLTQVTGANISIKVNDEFMEAAESDSDFILSWPVDFTQTELNTIIKETDLDLEYNSIFKVSDKFYLTRVRAKEIWDKFIYQAHKNAEPGILFWDNIIKESPADCYVEDGFKTMGTNPCGEVPLSAYDSCRLGSINLCNMVKNGYTKKSEIDWDRLKSVSHFAQRAMDDVVDLEEEKVLEIIAKIKKDPESPHLKAVELHTWESVLNVLKKGRRTGIGVLGLGDMLAKLGITYGSKEATKIIDKIFKFISVEVIKESVILAKQRGAFPIFDYNKEKDNPFLNRVINDNFSRAEKADIKTYGRRNIASLSIAPTGSLAIEARTTSGIEPVFTVSGKRRRKINPNETGVKVDFVDDNGDSWQEYNVFHYEFIKWHIQETLNNSGDLLDFEAAKTQLASLSDELLAEMILKSPWAGSEAHDVDYMEKVKMQGVVQQWIDHSISITHNLPKEATLEEVNDIYFAAWKAGCKGCTIYREGSRAGVLLTNKKEEKEKEENVFGEHDAPKRPKELVADYYVAKANGREFAVMFGLWPGTSRPYEVFAFENPPASKNTKGKLIKVRRGQYKFINGEFEIENVELAADKIEQRMLTLTASMLLRHGAPINHVNNMIKKIDDNVTSFSSVVRRYLSRYVEVEDIDEACPQCDSGKLVREEGCVHCDTCSFSKCG